MWDSDFGTCLVWASPININFYNGHRSHGNGDCVEAQYGPLDHADSSGGVALRTRGFFSHIWRFPEMGVSPKSFVIFIDHSWKFQTSWASSSIWMVCIQNWYSSLVSGYWLYTMIVHLIMEIRLQMDDLLGPHWWKPPFFWGPGVMDQCCSVLTNFCPIWSI